MELIIDKNFLFRCGSIGWLFLAVKGYFASCCSENQVLAVRFEEEGGSVAAILRNQLIFWSSHLVRQKTLNKECSDAESIRAISSVIFPLFKSIRNILCRKMASSFFNSRGGATRNMPLLP